LYYPFFAGRSFFAAAFPPNDKILVRFALESQAKPTFLDLDMVERIGRRGSTV
jgi:hypothetical protein